MSNEKKPDVDQIIGDYKYGFKTDNVTNIYSTKMGLSRDIIREISAIKNEPQWMLDIRLAAYESFLRIPNPKWGPDLSFINFDDIIYYIKSSDRVENSWEDVPSEIKDTFQKLVSQHDYRIRRTRGCFPRHRFCLETLSGVIQTIFW